MTLLENMESDVTVEHEPPLIETENIPNILLNGGAVFVEDGLLRVVGWQKLTTPGSMPERRVVVRFSMPLGTAVAFYKLIGASLSAKHRGSH